MTTSPGRKQALIARLRAAPLIPPPLLVLYAYLDFDFSDVNNGIWPGIPATEWVLYDKMFWLAVVNMPDTLPDEGDIASHSTNMIDLSTRRPIHDVPDPTSDTLDVYYCGSGPTRGGGRCTLKETLPWVIA